MSKDYVALQAPTSQVLVHQRDGLSAVPQRSSLHGHGAVEAGGRKGGGKKGRQRKVVEGREMEGKV